MANGRGLMERGDAINDPHHKDGYGVCGGGFRPSVRPLGAT